jgi:hypothetical protein
MYFLHKQPPREIARKGPKPINFTKMRGLITGMSARRYVAP